MIMKWRDNLINIAQAGESGKCPHCGSARTDYKCTIVVPDKRLGYMDIWCNDCLRAYHVSRMEVPEDLKTDGEIPQGLTY